MAKLILTSIVILFLFGCAVQPARTSSAINENSSNKQIEKAITRAEKSGNDFDYFRYVKILAERGMPFYAGYLGDAYYEGRGTEKNDYLASYWYKVMIEGVECAAWAYDASFAYQQVALREKLSLPKPSKSLSQNEISQLNEEAKSFWTNTYCTGARGRIMLSEIKK